MNYDTLLRVKTVTSKFQHDAKTKQEEGKLWEAVLQRLRDQGEDVEALLEKTSAMMAWHDSPIRASGEIEPDEV